MSVDAAVVAVHAESVIVEHGADDPGSLHAVALAVGELDRGRVGEAEARTRTLPKRDFLGLLETSILVMEGVGLEEDVGGRTEIRVHDNMLKITRAESLHAADIEQSGHSGHTANGDGHLVGGVADKVGIDNGVRRRERLGVLLVEAIQQVDAPGVTSTSVGAAAVHVVEGLGHHVVDGTHDEVIEGNRHGLLNLVEKHGEEAIELGRAGEGLVHGLLLHGSLDLERGHLIEELDVHVRLVEHVGIVGGTVGQVPALVLGSGGQPGADLLQNGAVSPIVHHDGRSGAGIRTVDEHNLADMVDEGTYETVKSVGVENLVACIHEAIEVLGDQVIFAECLGERVVDDLVNLFYFHCYSPFSLVG